ncbi:Multidrug resistance protein 3 [compost metagenome]
MQAAFGGAGAPGGVSGSFGEMRDLLSSEKRDAIPHEVMDKIVHALSSSISTTFLWALVPAVLIIAVVPFMGNARMELPPKGVKKQPQA